mmetsp:Transcript_24200/g.52191  ORF Transcript_24200/g.52191 Transcript_24200/m.52191 type:complete len:107 (+) Transcript_24200:1000-1320(+)
MLLLSAVTVNASVLDVLLVVWISSEVEHGVLLFEEEVKALQGAHDNDSTASIMANKRQGILRQLLWWLIVVVFRDMKRFIRYASSVRVADALGGSEGEARNEMWHA